MVISKEAEDMIRSLEKWLLSNGEYKPAPELRYFDQCVSTGLEREISGLRDEVGSQITDVSILWQKHLVFSANNTLGTNIWRRSKAKRSYSGRMVNWRE